MSLSKDVIKYDGDNNAFVYKYPAEDFESGTQLIVRESQEAIFFRDGKVLDRFNAGRYTLEDDSMSKAKGFFQRINGSTRFQGEIYFVNLVTIMGVKWGTDSKVRMFDPATGMHLEIGAFGQFNIHVSDAEKVLLKLVGAEMGLKKEDILGGTGYSTSSFSGKFRTLIMAKVKSYLPKAIRENGINILEVDEHLDEIGEYIRRQLNTSFESYGLYITEFFVANVTTPDDDPNFKRLKAQHAAKYLLVEEERIKKAEAEARKERVTVEAETQAEVKIISVKAEEEAMRRMAYANAERIREEGLAKVEVMEAQQGIGQSNPFTNNDFFATETKPASSQSNSHKDSSWVCPSCGHEGNVGKFCEECGTRRIQDNGVWTCPFCGHKGNTGKFCGECGTKRA